MARHAKSQHKEEWDKLGEVEKNQPTIQSLLLQKQEKIQKYAPNSEKRHKLNEKLVTLIIKDMRPLSIVRNKGFRDFVETLDPRYSLPSTKTLGEKLIPRIYNQNMIDLMSSLETISNITLTTDGWTSSTADKYQVYTIHFVNWTEKEPQIHSKILECAPYDERNSGIELEKDLRRVTTKYGINKKLVLTVADNESAIQLALKIFGVARIGCAAHKLNLCAKTIHKHMKDVKTKMSSIVRTTKISSTAKKTLLECQREVGFKGKIFI